MIVQQDTYTHKGMRNRLIAHLRSQGITDEDVLNAMNAIPRHFFLDPAFAKIAYEDRAFPIGEDQTISQPYTVAYQTQLLEIKKMDKVLEIGTGSVYQSTILAEMGAKVFTIERQKKLFDKVKTHYPFRQKYQHAIKFFYGDGFLGLPTFAPFDKIIITAAAPFVPEKLLEQLKPNGKFVLPVDNEKGTQTMTRITKLENGELHYETFEGFSFVPMLIGKKN